MIVSHSDGINPFVSMAADRKIKDPCYCATLAIEFEVKEGRASVRHGAESVFII